MNADYARAAFIAVQEGDQVRVIKNRYGALGTMPLARAASLLGFAVESDASGENGRLYQLPGATGGSAK